MLASFFLNDYVIGVMQAFDYKMVDTISPFLDDLVEEGCGKDDAQVSPASKKYVDLTGFLFWMTSPAYMSLPYWWIASNTWKITLAQHLKCICQLVWSRGSGINSGTYSNIAERIQLSNISTNTFEKVYKRFKEN